MHVLGNFGMGGAEMGVLRLIQNFPSGAVRHSVTIIGGDCALLDESGANLRLHALGISGRSYGAFWRLKHLFRQQKTDIVHVNNLSPWFDCALAARLAGCRCIATFHGIEQGVLSFPKWRKWLFQLSGGLTDGVTAVAEPAADLLVELTGITRNRVEVIPNGIDTQRFSPLTHLDEKNRLRKAKGFPEKALILGCVAALRPVKNHLGLLQAFAKAVKNGRLAAELVLVGDGPLTEELQSLSRELGIAENVRFLGRRSDVRDLLRCFDAFFLNSDTEGLSYAVLEAMACGLPVIATAVGANPDLITPGVTGFLVPPADLDALSDVFMRLGTASDALPAMGAQARLKIFEEFSLHRMTLAYQKLYERTMSRK